MPVMPIYRSDDFSADDYANFRNRFPLVAAPRGAISHVHGKTDSGFVTVEVWEDADSLLAFVDGVLAPLAQELRLPLVRPEVIEVEDLVLTPAWNQVALIPFNDRAYAQRQPA